MTSTGPLAPALTRWCGDMGRASDKGGGGEEDCARVVSTGGLRGAGAARNIALATTADHCEAEPIEPELNRTTVLEPPRPTPTTPEPNHAVADLGFSFLFCVEKE